MSNIRVVGARVHNLKNITVEIPRDKLTVITGISGSGKSSLAFDTIYAEGQRRYVESLSSYARQFLGVMEKPDVDYIEGLSPAISIDQRSASKNPRSTVGTVTEIYDYLRLLFARIGKPHCPIDGQPIEKLSRTQIATRIIQEAQSYLEEQRRRLGRKDIDLKLALLAPMVIDKKGEHKGILEGIYKAGFARVRIDKTIMPIEEALETELDKQKKHNIEVVVDRLIFGDKFLEDDRLRLVDSLEKALDLSKGLVYLLDYEKNLLFASYSENFACPRHPEITLKEIEPRIFSFNSPHGACPICQGLGKKLEIDPDLLIPNKMLTFNEGAIRAWSRNINPNAWYYRIIESVANRHNIDLDQPIEEMPKERLDILLYGTSNELYHFGPYTTTYEGIIPNLTRRYHETDSDFIREELEKYMVEVLCPACRGRRLKNEVLGILVNKKNIAEVCALSIGEAKKFFENLKLSASEEKIARLIIKEIKERLQFLIDVGLSYLTIDRSTASLSGGEAQRIRLATQIGSSLVGVLYVLDEPSIGLHQHDHQKLLLSLKRLRDLGNTVIVVEHDRETMLAADYLIDIGPGAGKAGGKVVAVGPPQEFAEDKRPGLTADYLSGKASIPLPAARRPLTDKFLLIKGAREHNLKNLTVKIPLGVFVCIAGVSGSGKSTLIIDILASALKNHFYKTHDPVGACNGIEGINLIDKMINIDQSPIGRTPRSNPATYTGVFTFIRELFASTPEARARGYNEGRFSFNVKGGRCEACQGEGQIKIEMHFLPDIYITCEECKGKRYNPEALTIFWRGKNIADVLEMTADEALRFFASHPQIKNKLQALSDVGLDYIHLGQPATTLSGGEAQRVKLATELSKKATGKTLYILDEPTTGLHFEDIKRLLKVLHRLVSYGNTVIVIEHNLDVLKNADWLIDLGPEGGEKGGYIVAEGAPEEVANNPHSLTGKYLKPLLK